MTLGPLNWAKSKTVGGVTEIAVMAPIKKGQVFGERGTYEERARTLIATIERRVEQGIPTELDAVPTIHFGEIVVIRPEQYLVYSDVDDVAYRDSPDHEIPMPIEEYASVESAGQKATRSENEQVRDDGSPRSSQTNPLAFRTWLLIVVFFDGDLKAYFKDISVFTNLKFDQIFENCEDYPARGTTDFEAFWSWIRRYQLNVDLFYPRYPELSVVRIKQLEAFKRRFDAFVARVRGRIGSRPHAIDDLLDEFLRENEQYPSNFPAPGGVFEPGHD
jgi:hypothetical protein